MTGILHAIAARRVSIAPWIISADFWLKAANERRKNVKAISTITS
jgi:hypothetical protein